MEVLISRQLAAGNKYYIMEDKLFKAFSGSEIEVLLLQADLEKATPIIEEFIRNRDSEKS